jgi:DNA modification methylase
VNERRLELVPLDELERAPRNPKDHDAEGITASVKRFGYAEPVLIDERTGRLVAGHGRLDALAAMLGAGQAPPEGILERDGRWLVPVVRGWASRSDADAEAYLVASNRLTMAGGWDDQALGEVLADLAREPDGLVGVGYSDTEVAALLASLATDDVSDEEVTATDAVEPARFLPPEDPVTARGDVWTLGRHRLRCGDSLVPKDLDALLDDEEVDVVVTDPPYAIYGSSTGVASDIADDRMVVPFFEATLRATRRALVEFGHAYVHCDWRSWAALWEAARRAGLAVHNGLVWDKGGAGLGSHYANTYELVCFLAKLPPAPTMTNRRKAGQRPVHASNVLRYPRPAGDERHHNAAKPVPMLEEFVRNSTDDGGLVLDLFVGSGSTLIAAERTGRRCRAMELAPAWCDVTARRWAVAARGVPLLNGAPHRFEGLA